MSSRGGWWAIVFLLILHFGLHPGWNEWPISLDLLAGAVLPGSLLLRPDQAAILGAVIGILEASISLGPLGPTMFILAAVGFSGAWLRDVLYSDSPQFVPTFLFVGVWTMQAALTLLTDGETSAGSLLLYAPISALLTAVMFWVAQHFLGIRGSTVFSRKRGLN